MVWVSQKQWMLELSNLCHCVQHPQKLTSRGFWSSRNERKPLSKQKCVLGNAVGNLRNSECWSFQTFAIVFRTPKNLLVGVSGALGMKVSHFLSKNVFWENAVGYLRNSKCWSFPTFAIVFSTPKNLLVEVSGALGMKVSHFLSKNVFWENAEVGSSAKFCVVVCKSSLLWYQGVIGQRRFVCQVWFSSIQSISAWLPTIVFSTPENLLVGISGALGIKESQFLS